MVRTHFLNNGDHHAQAILLLKLDDSNTLQCSVQCPFDSQTEDLVAKSLVDMVTYGRIADSGCDFFATLHHRFHRDNGPYLLTEGDQQIIMDNGVRDTELPKKLDNFPSVQNLQWGAYILQNPEMTVGVLNDTDNGTEVLSNGIEPHSYLDHQHDYWNTSKQGNQSNEVHK